MILVVGATGQLGSRVTGLLADRLDDRPASHGDEVRCLVRPGSDAEVLHRPGVAVVAGDLVDHASLAPACAGVATVVVTATAIVRRLTSTAPPSLHDVDELGVTALVDEAERAGVERFVYVSFAGVDRAYGSPLDRAKAAVERRLASSTMRTVVVRPDAFQDVHLAPVGRFDVRAGRVAVFGRGDAKHRWIAVDDVAALVVALVLEDDPPGLVEVGGPEALSRNETIAVVERLRGRPVRRQHVPRLVARVGMRLLDRRRDGLASIFGTGLLLDSPIGDWDDGPLRARGISPRTTTAWLEQQVAAVADDVEEDA